MPPNQISGSRGICMCFGFRILAIRLGEYRRGTVSHNLEVSAKSAMKTFLLRSLCVKSPLQALRENSFPRHTHFQVYREAPFDLDHC